VTDSVIVGGGGAPGGLGAPCEPQQQRGKARRKQRQKRSYLAAAQAGYRSQRGARAGLDGAGALHRPPEAVGVAGAACSIGMCDNYWRIYHEYVAHYGELIPAVGKFHKDLEELSKVEAWQWPLKLDMVAKYESIILDLLLDGDLLKAKEIDQVIEIDAMVHVLAKLSGSAYVEGPAWLSLQAACVGSGLYSCLGLRGWSSVRSGRDVRLGCQGSIAVVGMAYEADAFGHL
jgi:hypothetical protein